MTETVKPEPWPVTNIQEPDDTSWMNTAACRGADINDFVTERGQTTDPARAICATCDHTQTCLEFSLLNMSHSLGIWGGKSHRQRKAIQRQRLIDAGTHLTPAGILKPGPSPTSKPIDHGTERGYAQHRRRGEPACAECRTAQTEAVSRRRREQRQLRAVGS